MRILVDITETAANGLRTGIQRVVRSIIDRSQYVSTKFGIEITPVVAIGDAFHRVADPLALLNARPPLSNSLAYRRPANLKSRALQLAKHILLRLPAVARAARRGLYRHRLRRAHKGGLFEKQPVPIEQGDVILLLDSFWTATALDAAIRARAGGATIVAVIYDLIPLTHPRYFDAYTVKLFKPAIERLLRHAEHVFGISAFCANEIRAYAPTRNAAQSNSIDFFHLGSDFLPPSAVPGFELERRLPSGFFDGASVFLMIGTLEPRKGHGFALTAFERRWRSGATDKLLWIGKAGWDVDDLLRRAQASPFFGTRLLMINDASDAEIVEAIQKCHACVLASEIEGFGLPLVEAMQMGLPVLASDIPVFREIGGDYPVYFTLDDPENLNDAIETLALHYADIRARLKKFRWLSWDEATEELFRKLVTWYQNMTPPARPQP